MEFFDLEVNESVYSIFGNTFQHLFLRNPAAIGMGRWEYALFMLEAHRFWTCLLLDIRYV